MEPEPNETAFELVKYILALATLPLWGPFAKALWDEFLLALRADGGLSGPQPTPRERSRIEEEIEATEEPRQVHEPIAHLRTGPTGPSSRGRATAPPGPAAPRRPVGPQTGTRRRAFARADGRGETRAAPASRPRFR